MFRFAYNFTEQIDDTMNKTMSDLAYRGWDDPAVPKVGWWHVSVEDEGDTTASCAMCGNERVRFVHLMQNAAYTGLMGVGCICAGKMTQNPDQAKQLEKDARARSVRRETWLKRVWRVSRKGNEYLNMDGCNIGVHQNRDGSWGWRVESRFSPGSYQTMRQAKLALFEAMNQ